MKQIKPQYRQYLQVHPRFRKVFSINNGKIRTLKLRNHIILRDWEQSLGNSKHRCHVKRHLLGKNIYPLKGNHASGWIQIRDI